MLLRRRTSRIEDRPANVNKGFEHLQEDWISVLGWLRANEVEFVLVGPVAAAVRGDRGARGPVAIVPAPYRRNFERLARARDRAHVKLRREGAAAALIDGAPVKMTAQRLSRGARWALICGRHELDIVAALPGPADYHERRYEANRFQLTAELAVEVASPEDIEHFEHLRRTGVAPEMRITRTERVQQDKT